jgi:hypothetical protein
VDNESQVEKLLAAKMAYDDGTGTSAELLSLVSDSTGYEINEAMDRDGGDTESWAQIKGPWR